MKTLSMLLLLFLALRVGANRSVADINPTDALIVADDIGNVHINSSHLHGNASVFIDGVNVLEAMATQSDQLSTLDQRLADLQTKVEKMEENSAHYMVRGRNIPPASWTYNIPMLYILAHQGTPAPLNIGPSPYSGSTLTAMDDPEEAGYTMTNHTVYKVKNNAEAGQALAGGFSHHQVLSPPSPSSLKLATFAAKIPKHCRVNAVGNCAIHFMVSSDQGTGEWEQYVAAAVWRPVCADAGREDHITLDGTFGGNCTTETWYFANYEAFWMF